VFSLFSLPELSSRREGASDTGLLQPLLLFGQDGRGEVLMEEVEVVVAVVWMRKR
jgi:hypothetical protein